MATLLLDRSAPAAATRPDASWNELIIRRIEDHVNAVAYTSAHGATQEIAERLRAAGLPTEARAEPLPSPGCSVSWRRATENADPAQGI